MPNADAETEAEARIEALQCLTESPDLFVIWEIPEESDDDPR